MQTLNKPVNVVEIVTKSSALEGMKIREVTAATVVDTTNLRQFVQKIERIADGDYDELDDTEMEGFESTEEDGAPVMAGERARRFSELPPEFDGEEGPAAQRRRSGGEDDAVDASSGAKRVRPAVSKAPRMPIRMMAGREKFDFVSAFREAPVTGLNWGSFFDLAPIVKRDICHLLVQERVKSLGKGKGKGKGKAKAVTIDVATGDGPEQEEVLTVATDRHLGDVANFYTKGILHAGGSKYRIKGILVDAGSVVNLMPIHLLRFVGAKLHRANGMVIRTATNARANIAYCADVRISISGISCDLRVYALPEEYKPTYPLLLSRRWLQAVKAKGDYANGQYFMMSEQGTRVRIPRGRGAQVSPQRHRTRVPIVMRDKNAETREMSAEIEEDLECQRLGGSGLFEDVIRSIVRLARQQIRREEEEEKGELSDESEN